MEGQTAQARFGDQVPVPVTTFSPIATGGWPSSPSRRSSTRTSASTSTSPRACTTTARSRWPLKLEISQVGPLLPEPAHLQQPHRAEHDPPAGRRDQHHRRPHQRRRAPQPDRDPGHRQPALRRPPVRAQPATKTTQTDIVMTLTPHIIRRTQFTEEDLRSFSVGGETSPLIFEVPAIPPVATPPPRLSEPRAHRAHPAAVAGAVAEPDRLGHRWSANRPGTTCGAPGGTCAARGASRRASVLMLAVGIAGTTVMFTLIQGVLLAPAARAATPSGSWAAGRRAARRRGIRRTNPYDQHRDRVPRPHQPHAGERRGRRLQRRLAPRWSSRTERPATSTAVDAVPRRLLPECSGSRRSWAASLGPADDVRRRRGALVITHALWQRRYGGSRDVSRPPDRHRRPAVHDRGSHAAGRRAPARRGGVELAARNGRHALTNPAFRVGMLRDLTCSRGVESSGFTLAQAAAELQASPPGLRGDGPCRARRAVVMPVLRTYEDMVTGEVRTTLAVLFGAVSLVLLIATANVANLLLLRGEARRPERLPGEPRWARPGAPGAAGAGREPGATRWPRARWRRGLASDAGGLIALLLDRLPRPDSVRVDTGVLLFTIAVAFLAASHSRPRCPPRVICRGAPPRRRDGTTPRAHGRDARRWWSRR